MIQQLNQHIPSQHLPALQTITGFWQKHKVTILLTAAGVIGIAALALSGVGIGFAAAGIMAATAGKCLMAGGVLGGASLICLYFSYRAQQETKRRQAAEALAQTLHPAGSMARASEQSIAVSLPPPPTKPIVSHVVLDVAIMPHSTEPVHVKEKKSWFTPTKIITGIVIVALGGLAWYAASRFGISSPQALAPQSVEPSPLLPVQTTGTPRITPEVIAGMTPLAPQFHIPSQVFSADHVPSIPTKPAPLPTRPIKPPSTDVAVWRAPSTPQHFEEISIDWDVTRSSMRLPLFDASRSLIPPAISIAEHHDALLALPSPSEPSPLATRNGPHLQMASQIFSAKHASLPPLFRHLASDLPPAFNVTSETECANPHVFFATPKEPEELIHPQSLASDEPLSWTIKTNARKLGAQACDVVADQAKALPGRLWRGTKKYMDACHEALERDNTRQAKAMQQAYSDAVKFAVRKAGTCLFQGLTEFAQDLSNDLPVAGKYLYQKVSDWGSWLFLPSSSPQVSSPLRDNRIPLVPDHPAPTHVLDGHYTPEADLEMSMPRDEQRWCAEHPPADAPIPPEVSYSKCFSTVIDRHPQAQGLAHIEYCPSGANECNFKAWVSWVREKMNLRCDYLKQCRDRPE